MVFDIKVENVSQEQILVIDLNRYRILQKLQTFCVNYINVYNKLQRLSLAGLFSLV